MPALSVPLPGGTHQPLLAALVAYAQHAFALPAPTSGPVVTLRSSWNLVRLDVNDPPPTRHASLALLAAFRACFQGYALGTTPVSLVVRAPPPPPSSRSTSTWITHSAGVRTSR